MVTLEGVEPLTPEPEPSPSTSLVPVPVPSVEDIRPWWENVQEQLISFGVVLVVALILWLVGRAAIRGLTRAVERGAPTTDPRALRAMSKARIKVPPTNSTEERLEAERRRQRAGTLRKVLESALAVLLVVIVIMTGLSVLGVPIGPMVASAGILGVALGFGAQSLVKDILSGVFMLIEDQYGVGDVVDLGEAAGGVEEVGLRTTRLRALDGTVWYVPNGEIRRVGNMTRLWSRVLIEVRFAYDTDIEAARQAMLDAVDAAKESDETVASAVLSTPEVAGIESLEYNAIMLRLMCQVNPATQWAVQREVRREMRRLFAERDISLAVPGDAMMFDAGAGSSKTPPRGPARSTKNNAGRPQPPANSED